MWLDHLLSREKCAAGALINGNDEFLKVKHNNTSVSNH